MALAVMVAGLILGSLLVLSYRLWRESERRAQSLRALNDTVNAHLHRELSLRHANERIMEAG